VRRLPRPSPHHASRDRWLVSYADFITLLFAFFATLYAISKVDTQKLSTVAAAMQEAFDDSPKARAKSTSKVHQTAALTSDVPASIEDVQEALAKALADELGSERLKLIVDRRGVTLSIPEAGAFAVASDGFSDTAKDLVAKVSDTLRVFPNSVRVEGHTDDVPIHNIRFQSNWDLSAARASRVVEFLIARGFQPERLSATGFGEFHPRVPNTTPESRAANRRIDLVVLNQATTTAEEPAQAGGTP
jgi:chemotaxis protein MotB